VLEIFAAARRDHLDAGEFARARSKLASRVVLAGERPRRRLFDVGGEWAHTGRYRTVAETLAIVESLTLDDVQRVLDRWPLDGAACTVLAGPREAG
jgi:predicted Zn-dependent peptidase